MRIGLILFATLFLTACGSSLTVTEDDEYNAKNCTFRELSFDTNVFLGNDSELAKNKMIEFCKDLSDGALKAVFLKHMSDDMEIEVFEILEEKFVKIDRGIGGRKYIGKAKTLKGNLAFTAHISEEQGIVIRVAEAFD